VGDGSGIDIDVKTLIIEKIESVEHIEILLLLHANPSKSFSAAEVSQKLRTGEDSTMRRLADMTVKGLVQDVQSEGKAMYSIATRDPALSALVAKLLKTYQERRVSVLTLIFSKPLEKIQVFADAFKIKRGKDDG
jgi:hypothetical protein